MLRRNSGNEPVDGVLVAENSGWKLFRIDGGSNGWTRLKLVSKIARGKANFSLASNGERLARNRESAALEERYPEIREWVTEKVSA